MKYLVSITLSILLLSAIESTAQENDEFVYTDVVHVEGISKSELYQRALQFITRTFKGPKDVIQIQDKEAGNIVSKGAMDVNLAAEDYITYTLQIIVKDGRYKYILRDFYHEGTYNNGRTRNAGLLADAKPDCGSGKMAGWYWRKIKTRSDEQAKKLVERVITDMNKKSEIDDF